MARALIGFILVFLLVCPFSVQAQTQKIRVVVKNASIRLSPSMDSEVLRKPNIGAVFDVVKKVDEWYEVKFTSTVGVEITGYIHEMFVELMQTEVVPEREPEIRQPVEVEVQREPPAYPKSEVMLSFRYPFGYSLNETSVYSTTWGPYVELQSVSESVSIGHQLKGPLGFGVAFNQLLFGGLGIQVRFDMNTKDMITDDSLSGYTLNFNWYGRSTSTFTDEWPVTGEISLMILSLNLSYKALGLGMIAPHISAGVSYFTGSMLVETNNAIAGTWINWDTLMQYIDWWAVPFEIDSKISSIGFNAGAGIDIILMPNLALTLGARYYYASEIQEHWQLFAGSYDSTNYIASWDISQEIVDHIQENISHFVFNPSFFSVLFAIKLMF